MAEDVIYAATSEHAASMATLALKGVVASTQMLANGAGPSMIRLVSDVAEAAVAMERAQGRAASPDADVAFTEGTPEWRTLHSSVAREIAGHGASESQTPVARMIGDMAVQMQAQGIILALDDKDHARTLDLSDRNVMEAMREGGDLEDLVRNRARGDYHKLTPDQQDDVAEAIAKGSMASPAVKREMDRAQRLPPDPQIGNAERGEHLADMLAMTGAGYMPPLGRQHVERARDIADGTVRPENETEMAVAAHVRTHRDPLGEAALVARASALATGGVSEAGPRDLAAGIEQHRLAIVAAQERVRDGTSSPDDRHIAVGQTSRASPERQRDLVIAIATAPDVTPLTRARLGRHVEDVAAEAPRRAQGIDAARMQAMERDRGR